MVRVAEGVTSQVAHERRFWENDPVERPGSDSLENVLNKAVDAAIFNTIVDQYAHAFEQVQHVLEVGGGQGWASCVVKRRFPLAHVTLTDAVDAAVTSRHIWERVFGVRLDDAITAPAQALPIADATMDLVFCFAAAHHFVDYAAALREAHRVLRSGGRCLWLYEPTTPRLWHGIAESRVNRKRVDVPEHVIVLTRLLATARNVGFAATAVFAPEGFRRGRLTSLYYNVLSVLPVLTRLFPCTAHFSFVKHAADG